MKRVKIAGLGGIGSGWQCRSCTGSQTSWDE
jgi:hypothetical protein